MLAARHEKTDGTIAALTAGLRAIPASRLATYWRARAVPTFGLTATHADREVESPTTRLRYVTGLALTVGAWSAVAFDDVMCARVAMVLCDADGDIVLERVAKFVRDGSLFDA